MVYDTSNLSTHQKIEQLEIKKRVIFDIVQRLLTSSYKCDSFIALSIYQHSEFHIRNRRDGSICRIAVRNNWTQEKNTLSVNVNKLYRIISHCFVWVENEFKSVGSCSKYILKDSDIYHQIILAGLA